MREATVKALAALRPVRTFRLFSKGASAAAVVVGSLVLLGWWLGIPTLTSVFPGLATMKPNTALCFVLVGLSLFLIQPPSGETGSLPVRRAYANNNLLNRLSELQAQDHLVFALWPMRATEISHRGPSIQPASSRALLQCRCRERCTSSQFLSKGPAHGQGLVQCQAKGL